MRRLLTALLAATALTLIPTAAHAPTTWHGQYNPAATLDTTQVVAGAPVPDGCSEDDLDCLALADPAAVDRDVTDAHGTVHHGCVVVPESDDAPAVITCEDGWTEES